MGNPICRNQEATRVARTRPSQAKIMVPLRTGGNVVGALDGLTAWEPAEAGDVSCAVFLFAANIDEVDGLAVSEGHDIFELVNVYELDAVFHSRLTGVGGGAGFAFLGNGGQGESVRAGLQFQAGEDPAGGAVLEAERRWGRPCAGGRGCR